MEILRKPIHKYHGLSVYEIKELAVSGFQYRYQIMSDNGVPLTEKYSSLEYVMRIYQSHVGPEIDQLINAEITDKNTIKQL